MYIKIALYVKLCNLSNAIMLAVVFWSWYLFFSGHLKKVLNYYSGVCFHRLKLRSVQSVRAPISLRPRTLDGEHENICSMYTIPPLRASRIFTFSRKTIIMTISQRNYSLDNFCPRGGATWGRSRLLLYPGKLSKQSIPAFYYRACNWFFP